MTQQAALMFLEGFRDSFADHELTSALEQEDPIKVRARLNRLTALESEDHIYLSECGVFAATYARDILMAFDKHCSGEFSA